MTYTIRRATSAEAPIIAQQRRGMFEDMGGSYARYLGVEGMDEAFIRDRLFKPFFTTKASRGMGIGAYQAREYVRSLGGSVGVDSTPGRGTVFRIRLPLVEAAAVDAATAANDQLAAAP